MRLIPLVAAALACLSAAPVAAQTVDGAAARGALFSTKGVKVVVFNLPQLTEQDRFVLGELGKQQKYYGAVAISPDAGLMSEATLAGANYHAIAPAEAAALAACDAARAAGSARCVIAAHILPANHEPRALQLSVDATEGFQNNGSGGGPKALALSPGTGEWALARGAGAPEAAIEACNQKATRRGAADCTLAIVD